VRFAIFAHESCPVEAEDHRQVLDGNVVDDAVVRALEEMSSRSLSLGRRPRVAMPAANVTACASAMPTSKKRAGCALATAEVPVPLGMAAVIATRSSRSS
jgi:hypothetical protein